MSETVEVGDLVKMREDWVTLEQGGGLFLVTGFGDSPVHGRYANMRRVEQMPNNDWPRGRLGENRAIPVGWLVPLPNKTRDWQEGRAAWEA